jgi:hypothetical protein
MADVDIEDPCAASNSNTYQGLRIASVFIIFVGSLVRPSSHLRLLTSTIRCSQVTSALGTIIPIALRRMSWIPKPIFELVHRDGHRYCPETEVVAAGK